MKKYFVNVLSEIGDITLVIMSENKEDAKKRAMTKYKIISITGVSEEPPNKKSTLARHETGFYSLTLPYQNTSKRYGAF